MRHSSFPRTCPVFSWLVPFFSGLAVTSSALATPVYLKVESHFPSGHYSRGVLEARTQRTQMQRWLRVETHDHAFGWIPEDDLLTPLKLAAEGEVTTKIVAPRSTWTAPEQRELLPPGRRVKILEVSGSYVHVHPQDAVKQTSFWLPTDAVKALHSTGEKAFVPRNTPIFILPGLHARVQFEARAASFYTILKQDSIWIEIRTPGGNAYLRRADAILLDDLLEGGPNGARPLTALVPLRSAPIPQADILRHLAAGVPLTVHGSQQLRWGLAKIREIGEVWWPINNVNFAFDDDDDGAASGAGPVNRGMPDERSREHLSTAVLFKRKIFDMAASPAVPNLKFASAGGVFRTTDGASWSKIPLFRNQDYPIAVAGNGSVFIGPFLSDDQGESFQEWIRWDSLFATLSKQIGHRPLPHGLKIQEIRPETPSGRRVVLKLNMGAREGSDWIVKLVSDDQGLNWKAL